MTGVSLVRSPWTWVLVCAVVLFLALDWVAAKPRGKKAGGGKRARAAAAAAAAVAPSSDDTDSADQDDDIAALEAIGYMDGSQVADADHAGVVVHDPARSWRGLNLVASGHGPEALLVDMKGRVLHTWRHRFTSAFPGEKGNKNKGYFRKVHLFPNGDLLAIFEGLGIIRIDRRSKLLWAVYNEAHHDMQVTPEGDIWVLTRRARTIKDMGRRPTLENLVSVLDANGKEKRSISLHKAYALSEFGEHFWPRGSKAGDSLHTNALEILDGTGADRLPALRAGNLLLSMRAISSLAILDVETERIVWSRLGPWQKQHDPHMLPDGHILLFDNSGVEGRSRIHAVDPVTGELAWTYRGSRDRPFYSKFCGTAQPLPNGNTLVTESDRGRAFELASGTDEIVWEFVSPHRARSNPALVATLFEVERLPPDAAERFLAPQN